MANWDLFIPTAHGPSYMLELTYEKSMLFLHQIITVMKVDKERVAKAVNNFGHF